MKIKYLFFISIFIPLAIPAMDISFTLPLKAPEAGKYIIKATQNMQPAGIIEFTLYQKESIHTGQIDYMRVEPLYRRNQLGFKLFKLCINFFKEHSCKDVSWCASPQYEYQQNPQTGLDEMVSPMDLEKLIEIYTKWVKQLELPQSNLQINSDAVMESKEMKLYLN